MNIKTSLMLNIDAIKYALWDRRNPKESIKAKYIGALYTGWGTFQYNNGESELYCNVDRLYKDVLFNSSPKGDVKDVKVGFRSSEGYIQWDENSEQVPTALRARASIVSREEFKQQNKRKKRRAKLGLS